MQTSQEEEELVNHFLECLRLFCYCLGEKIPTGNRVQIARTLLELAEDGKFDQSTIWSLASDLVNLKRPILRLKPKLMYSLGYFNYIKCPIPEPLRRKLVRYRSNIADSRYLTSNHLLHPIFRQELFRLCLPLNSLPYNMPVIKFVVGEFKSENVNFAWLLGLTLGNASSWGRSNVLSSISDLFNQHPTLLSACQQVSSDIGYPEAISLDDLINAVYARISDFYSGLTRRFQQSKFCLGVIDTSIDFRRYFFDKEMELQWVTYFRIDLQIPIDIAIQIARDMTINVALKNL